MKPSQGRRTWVKLWINDWLEGTTRYQMTGAQRAFWIDLLAMAGRSRFGGVVCSGKDGNQWIGYPLVKFQGLMVEPIDVLGTFDLFAKTGKITMEVRGDEPKLYTLFITNWAKYQSEYERNKKYRGEGSKQSSKQSSNSGTEDVQPKSQAVSQKSSTTEVEVDSDSDSDADSETDSDSEHAENKRAEHTQQKQKQKSAAFAAAGAPSTSPSKQKAPRKAVIDAFRVLHQKPFGSAKFKQIWTRMVQNLTEDPEKWSDFMEEAVKPAMRRR